MSEAGALGGAARGASRNPIRATTGLRVIRALLAKGDTDRAAASTFPEINLAGVALQHYPLQGAR